MKKIIFGTLLLAIASPSFAQKYMTRTAKVSFNATAPKSPEKIEAVNNEAAAILDTKTTQVVFQMPIKSFKFERELMQQHFNENYLESDKYPKAEFNGVITNKASVNFGKEGVYKTTVTGVMKIHGVDQSITVPGTVTIGSNGSISINTKFSIKLADYKITVASMVADKLAKEASITIDATLAQK